MSVKNGRLYQYLCDKLHFAPLALAGALTIRTGVRAGLFAASRLRFEKGEAGDVPAARARLTARFPKPALARKDAVYEPDDPNVDLSVVVPLYNAGAFLKPCLQSVCGQETRFRFEVILVDDGSTDDTADRAEAFAAREGVCLFRQANAGAAAARNAGLDRARGEYVMFADADDLLAPGAIEALMTAAREQDADWVQGSWAYVDGPRQIFPQAVYEGEGKMALIELPGMPWGKVMKRSLFKTLRFPAGYTSYVDTPIKCLTLPLCRRAATVPDVVYFWRRNPGGITFTSKKTPRALQSYWMMEQMEEDAKALGLPGDALRDAIWIRQMLSVNYDRLKGLDASVQRDVFTLSCDFLAPVLQRREKLPFTLDLARRAFTRRDFALWRTLGKWYALSL